MIVAECADNPGGGGTGRCTELLAALVKANARNVLYGSFFDPPLAAQAHELGVGARFKAEFNRHRACPATSRSRLTSRSSGCTMVRSSAGLGTPRAERLVLGPSAALRIGGTDGIVVVAISDRIQTADPMFFEMFGLDISKSIDCRRQVAWTFPHRLPALVPA